MVRLLFPFTEPKIRALKVGERVPISGVVFTGRGYCCQMGQNGVYFEHADTGKD